MAKIWINKANSFKEAEAFEREYYAQMTPSERIAVMQFLRESLYKLRKGRDGRRMSVRRLKRVARLVDMKTGRVLGVLNS